MLERLDVQANNAERASEQLRRTLQDVQHLLNPDTLTQYRFNKPARFAQNKSRPNQPTSTPSRSQVGAFANMVLNDRPNFHTATPSVQPPGVSSNAASRSIKAHAQVVKSATPTPVQVKQHHIPSSPASSVTMPASIPPSSSFARAHPQVVIPVARPPSTGLNSQASHQSQIHTQATVSSSQKSHFSEAASQSASQRSSVAIVIPQTLTEAQRAQYMAVPDTIVVAPRPQNKPTKETSQKHTDIKVDQRLTSASIAQQEKANAAVAKLQALISDIFEAEDQLQADTSGLVSSDGTRFFNTQDSTEGTPLLHSAVQTQLDSVLHKAIANGRLSSVSVENLGRLQRLCENATTAASITNYRIDDDTAQEVDEWLHRLEVGEQGLTACKTLLRIMTAGREEKQLYSEEALRNLMNTLSHVVETCVVPVVEMRSGGASSDSFKIAHARCKPLTQVLTACTRVIKLLGDLIAKTDVDESVIVSAEFICKTMVFVENATTERDAALGIQRFETARRAAMDVLAKIFARYPEQRQSIFDEILTSLEKLPVGRQSARQFKMIDAKPIQLVSALLMRLVQTSATRSKVRTIIATENGSGDKADTNSDAESSDEDADGDSDFDSENEKKRRPKPKSKKPSSNGPEDLPSIANPLYEAALRDAHYVVNYMVQRALTSTKSGDQPYRNLLDIFTEDFLAVLGNTDWPAAELFLRVLLQKLFELSENHKGSAPSKAMALELMGIMASRITELRLQAQSAARHHNPDQTVTSSKLLEFHESISADEVAEDEFFAFDGPYRVVLEYLQARGTDDAALATARGYHTVQWAKQILKPNQGSKKSKELEHNLASMIKDSSWLEAEL